MQDHELHAPMSPQEYAGLMASLGLSSHRQMARFLRMTPAASHNYASGKTPVPGPVAILLRLMARANLAPDRVARITA